MGQAWMDFIVVIMSSLEGRSARTLFQKTVVGERAYLCHHGLLLLTDASSIRFSHESQGGSQNVPTRDSSNRSTVF